MAISEGIARDKTEDWLLPEAARPRSFDQLEARIEYAVALARSAEAAVAEIGAAAIDAAEESRRAAELAERAALGAEEAARGGVAVAAAPAAVAGTQTESAGGGVALPETGFPEPQAGLTIPVALTAPTGFAGPENPAVFPVPSVEDLRLAHFMERADRVVERLRALELLAG